MTTRQIPTKASNVYFKFTSGATPAAVVLQIVFLILFGVFVEYDWTVDTRYDQTGLRNPQDDAKQPHPDGNDGPGETHQELYGSKYTSFYV